MNFTTIVLLHGSPALIPVHIADSKYDGDCNKKIDQELLSLLNISYFFRSNSLKYFSIP
jgi:hypothetical protein